MYVYDVRNDENITLATEIYWDEMNLRQGRREEQRQRYFKK